MNPIHDENTLFTATPVLPYRQQRTGPSPLHCTKWYLVSYSSGNVVQLIKQGTICEIQIFQRSKVLN
jgi:hypothetical protein